MISYDRYHQPIVLVRVNNASADDLVERMGQIEIHEDERRATKVTISWTLANASDNDIDGVADWEGTLIDDERCQPGSVWQIRWGYLDNLSDLITVKVLYFEPDFPESGHAKLKLYLTDRQVHINRDSNSRNWGRISSSEIAERIASRHGMEVNTEDSNDTRQRAYVQAATEPDIQFLQRLGARIRFLCYVENNVLHYHRAEWETPAVVELTWYGGDPYAILQSFRPTIGENIARRLRSTNEGDSAESENGGDAQSNLGTYIEVDTNDASVAKREDAARNEPTSEENESLRQRGAHAAQRKLLEAVREAQASCLGTPVLRRNTNVLVGGVGRDLSGMWHVKESTHTLTDQGAYRTRCKVKRGAAPTETRANGDTETAEGTQTTAHVVDPNTGTVSKERVIVTSDGNFTVVEAEDRR